MVKQSSDYYRFLYQKVEVLASTEVKNALIFPNHWTHNHQLLFM